LGYLLLQLLRFSIGAAALERVDKVGFPVFAGLVPVTVKHRPGSRGGVMDFVLLLALATRAMISLLTKNATGF
jgi:hypothetical protein